MRFVLLFALVGSLALTGCAAGGGGSTLPPVQPAGNATADAQAAAQAAMVPVSTGDLTAGLFGGGYGPMFSVAASPAVKALSMACVNRHEYIVTHTSPTETIYEIKYFYDAACSQLAKDVIADVTISSPSSESIARTATWFNHSGTKLADRAANFNITGSPGDFALVLTSAFYVGTSTQAANQFGGQLTVAPQGAGVFTVAGDHADIFNDVKPAIDKSFGVSAALQNVTATVDGSGDVTFAGGRTLSLAVAPLYGLTMPSAPPFVVSGGTMVGSGNAAGSVEFDAAGQLMLVDVTVNTVKGFNVVMTSSGSPGSIAINGTVTNPSGVQVATFTVDQYGDGVITYANGTQALIIDWRIVG